MDGNDLTKPLKVICVKGDMLDTAQALTKEHGKLFACLNMANAFHPGGAYVRGTAAQEENMARRTQMHFTFVEGVVENKGARTLYTQDMTDLVSGAHGRVYLSTEPLTCIRGRQQSDLPDLGYLPYDDCDIFPFLELRSAAVDKRKGSSSDDDQQMEARIEAQFATLIERDVRYVVLSAFGCGAFKNDSKTVALMYRRAIERHRSHFDVIAFAIYYAGYGPDNFPDFNTALSDLNEVSEEVKAAPNDGSE